MTQIIKNEINLNKTMSAFKQFQKGCDVDIILGDERIPMHSTVLAANCPYFGIHLFCTPFVPREITLDETNVQMIKGIFEYFYMGDLKLEVKDADSILNVAKFLMLEMIVEKYTETLKTMITVDNYVDIWRMIKKYDLTVLEQSFWKFLEENFHEIIESKGFLDLDLTQLVAVLKLKIKSRNENMVLNSVEKWVKQNFESRSKDVLVLLSHVNLSSLPIRTLTSKYKTLCKEMECLSAFLEAIEKKNDKGCEPKTLIVVGGSSNEQANTMEVYSVQSKIWTKVELQLNRIYSASVYYHNMLFIIGGQNSNNVSTVEAYYDRKLWTKSPMLHARSRFSAVVVEDYIYAIGGYDKSAISSMEKYNPITDKWTELTPMPTSRFNFRAVVIDKEIFVMGGNNDSRVIGENESYSVSTGTWRTFAPMQNKRCELAAAAIHGLIYVVGGHDDTKLSSVERYDPKLDKWIYLQNISTSIQGLAAVNFNDKLVISGGASTSVQQFDSEKNQWNPMTPLNINHYMHNMIEVPVSFLE